VVVALRRNENWCKRMEIEWREVKKANVRV
jgi:hypothetical protein